VSIFKSLKILCHKDRLDPYIAGYPNVCNTVPITIELDLTNACTHRCPRCAGMRTLDSIVENSFPVLGDGEEIPDEHAANYISQIAVCGVHGLIFTGGGEPSVHWSLVPLIKLATNLGLDVGLITNGSLLHRHDMASVVPLCSWIRFSVDAGTPGEYLRTHGRDATEWNQVWKNIRTTIEQRGDAITTIGVGFLADETNIEELPLLASLCDGAHIDYLQVRPFHSGLAFDPRAMIEKTRDLFKDSRLRIVASDQKYDFLSTPERTYTRCHIGQFASVICADEKVYLCCHTRGIPQFCLGDLRTTSLADILKSERRWFVLAKLNVNDCPLLCRGDQVNRQVEQILAGNIPESNDPPEHPNFL